jgi:DNA end-binding protein Ku
MHTVWKGSISFGLVSIPVKLFAATEDKDIKLKQIHNKCKQPIKQKKICPVCNEEVSSKDLVKAYEYAEGKFVVLDQDDLEKLKKEEQDKSVEIVDFIKLAEVDPIYFDKSYFLQADTNGNKAYALLMESLKTSKKIGLAKISIRSKERLAAIRVYKDYLMMETLHFPDEVRSVADIPKVSDVTLDKKEKDIALMLIEQLTTKFNPKKYTDEYRLELTKMIEDKVAKSKDVRIPSTGNVASLMDALQASIDATKESVKPKPKRARSKAKTTGRKKA